MTGNGSRSDVVPVGVVGSELLTSSSLDDVNPDRYVELTCEEENEGSQCTTPWRSTDPVD